MIRDVRHHDGLVRHSCLELVHPGLKPKDGGAGSAGAPASAADTFWPPIHGEERVSLPALPEFITLVEARGRLVEVRRIPGESRRFAGVDEAMGFLRQQLWVTSGGAKEARLRELAGALERDDEGGIRLAAEHRDIGIVTWASV